MLVVFDSWITFSGLEVGFVEETYFPGERSEHLAVIILSGLVAEKN